MEGGLGMRLCMAYASVPQTEIILQPILQNPDFLTVFAWPQEDYYYKVEGWHNQVLL
jgi:hypothetical protein